MDSFGSSLSDSRCVLVCQTTTTDGCTPQLQGRVCQIAVTKKEALSCIVVKIA